ncbi:hypothetical protein BdWA1_000798 [Babesia duncani]|uniref:Uncharacterized protein n=1 Tax=Babesia duncani TaxID=323732 RepID=A0AAD9PMT9_9APIC|nr:hypothetical protein BdWA1_000798 [Babesia duncani]
MYLITNFAILSANFNGSFQAQIQRHLQAPRDYIYSVTCPKLSRAILNRQSLLGLYWVQLYCWVWASLKACNEAA